MTTWYTADLHLDHANIIRYCDRPFSSAEEMDRELFRRWNETVAVEDTVWVLGDLALGPQIERTIAATANLNGQRILVPGNHDRVSSVYEGGDQRERFAAVYEAAGWRLVPEVMETVIAEHPVILSHYPYAGDTAEKDRFVSVRPVDHGLPVVHGHVHGEFAASGHQLNVGVDVRGFRPVAEREIVDWLESL